MKDILSNEQYCYKIHTLLMKSVLTPSPFIDNPLYGIPRTPPLPPFLQGNLDLLFYDFSKISPPL